MAKASWDVVIDGHFLKALHSSKGDCHRVVVVQITLYSLPWYMDCGGCLEAGWYSQSDIFKMSAT